MNLGLFKTSHFCLSRLVAGPIYSDILAGKIHIFLKMLPKTPLPFSLHLSQVSLEKIKKQKKIQRNLKYSAFTMLTFEKLILIYKLF